MDFEEFRFEKEEAISLIDQVLKEGNLTEEQARRLISVKDKIDKLACII